MLLSAVIEMRMCQKIGYIMRVTDKSLPKQLWCGLHRIKEASQRDQEIYNIENASGQRNGVRNSQEDNIGLTEVEIILLPAPCVSWALQRQDICKLPLYVHMHGCWFPINCPLFFFLFFPSDEQIVAHYLVLKYQIFWSVFFIIHSLGVPMMCTGDPVCPFCVVLDHQIPFMCHLVHASFFLIFPFFFLPRVLQTFV